MSFFKSKFGERIDRLALVSDIDTIVLIQAIALAFLLRLSILTLFILISRNVWLLIGTLSIFVAMLGIILLSKEFLVNIYITAGLWGLIWPIIGPTSASGDIGQLVIIDLVPLLIYTLISRSWSYYLLLALFIAILFPLSIILTISVLFVGIYWHNYRVKIHRRFLFLGASLITLLISCLFLIMNYDFNELWERFTQLLDINTYTFNIFPLFGGIFLWLAVILGLIFQEEQNLQDYEKNDMLKKAVETPPLFLLTVTGGGMNLAALLFNIPQLLWGTALPSIVGILFVSHLLKRYFTISHTIRVLVILGVSMNSILLLNHSLWWMFNCGGL